MLRSCAWLALTVGLLSLAARVPDVWATGLRPAPVNSMLGLPLFFEALVPELAESDNLASVAEAAQPDSVLQPRVLFFNYGAYDDTYINRIRAIVQRGFPSAHFAGFETGNAADLAALLSRHDMVIVAYPAAGTPEQIRQCGKELQRFARQGGVVLFTGTDQYAMLQHFGLIDIDFGYFCKDPQVHLPALDNALVADLRQDFTLRNYAYPLDVSDAAFVTLAEVLGYPTAGYKPLGRGKAAYLGFEYYYDEGPSSNLLLNFVRSAAQERGTPAAARPIKRSEEVFYAGTGGAGRTEVFDLKVYPNPYMSKATLDIELKKSTVLSVEMVDESGAQAALLLPQKSLSPGFYKIDLPANLSPGIYFLQCKTNEATTVRRVFKTSVN
jgi:hypothetical protein